MKFSPNLQQTAHGMSKQSSKEAGRQKNGNLWSTLKDVCSLLRIPAPENLATPGEEILFQHVHFKTGQRIHTIGQPFDMLYIINSGFLKTVMIDELGEEQILSFPMKSDLLGVDGIHSRYHTCEAVALSDCDLILVPFRKLASLGKIYPELEHAIYGVISRELVREQAMICILGTLSAEGRVARFLVSLSDRFAQMGYSHRIFNLRMTRHEIGSYIGLTLETVSRTLSALHDMGWISVDQKTIEIKDMASLRNLRRLPNTRSRREKRLEAPLHMMPINTVSHGEAATL